MPITFVKYFLTFHFVFLNFLFSQSVYFVSTAGNDSNPGTELQPWRSIRESFNSAIPGSIVYIKQGVYFEKDTLNVSGNATDGYITFRNYQNDTVIIDGSGIIGDQIIFINNNNYIKIIGLEIRNNLNQTFGSGIWIKGSCANIHIRNNKIHDMRAKTNGDCMAISVYGTSVIPISNIVIDSNLIYNCEPGHSEALTLNGNVDTFLVANNIVHDVNNIGIDMIGGEGECPLSSKDAARNGMCRNNTVYNAHSKYGGGYAAGIYVDGGINIIIECNRSYSNDIGIEVGCENAGRITSGVIVRNNLIYSNDKRGIGIGGYNFPLTGKVTSTSILNNTLFNNDILNTGEGEITVEYSEDCIIKNNILYSSSQNKLMVTTVGNASRNFVDYNLWFAPGGNTEAIIDYNGTVYTGFQNYLSGTGQDSHSNFDDPEFVYAALPIPDFHLRLSSPTIDAGDPSFIPAQNELDYDRLPRLKGAAVDVGAYENQITPPSAPIILEPENNSVFTSQSIPMKWESSDSGTIFQIQISTISDFTFLIVNDSTLSDTTYLFHPAQSNNNYFWRLRAFKSNFSGEWSEVRSFACNNQSQWKIVSLSFEVNDTRTSTLFPTALSNGFAFLDGRYEAQDSLIIGKGYWMKFYHNDSSHITGESVLSDTIDVFEGWNLIGSLSVDIPINSIISNPPDIFSSGFYTFENGYSLIDTLKTGRGCWIKSKQEGQIILDGSIRNNYENLFYDPH
jgi:hypothetical protein